MMSAAGDTVERLSRVLGVALSPGGLRGLLSWKPRSVAAVQLVGSLSRRGMSFATVVDVGANVGQFSRAALGFWPTADVMAFEPLPECAEALRLTVGPHGSLEVHAVALGREDGTVRFHPHDYTLSSSALAATEAAKREHAWAKERPMIEVPLHRLDTVLEGRTLRRPALLKLDVQGFELEVIAGARSTLAQIDALLVEVAFERAYEGQPLFHEVHDRLTGVGWELDGPVDARRATGRIVELDCLYLSPGEGGAGVWGGNAASG